MTNKDENKTKRRNDLQAVRIPYWLTEKAHEELSSSEQLIVYCWIFDHNAFALRSLGNIYGKHTYDTYHREITRDLNIKKPASVIAKLKKAKWIAEAWAAPYKGKPMKGYRCLLDSKQREMAKVEQQQMFLPDEDIDNATIVESSQPVPTFNDGMFHYAGNHWYEDADGTRHYVPQSEAYNRPSPEHVWDTEAVRWCLPQDLTERELEF